MTEDEFIRDLNGKQLTACLFNGQHEVTVAGYRAIPIRNWRITDEPSLAFAIRFGPYDAPIEYDCYAIFDGDTQKLVIPEDAPCSFPPGFTWDWHFEIEP
jgi:hypothetical protein